MIKSITSGAGCFFISSIIYPSGSSVGALRGFTEEDLKRAFDENGYGLASNSYNLTSQVE